MKMYLLSFGAGVLVGVVYALINVRSPAPPVIALVGLLGILLGEQSVPLAKRMMSSQSVSVGWIKRNVLHIYLANCRVGIVEISSQRETN